MDDPWRLDSFNYSLEGIIKAGKIYSVTQE
jgi:hypothetical protein